MNWGSTTQAQTYKKALQSVQLLNNVDEHVKNYRPQVSFHYISFNLPSHYFCLIHSQILVLTNLPNTRPLLVDFAYMLTKNLSLLVCGHVNSGPSSQKHRSFMQRRATEWFQKHKVKAFYTFVDGENFETGSRALMQASGVGKLKPNILLMGFKADWRTCGRSELEQYFNTIHKVSIDDT